MWYKRLLEWALPWLWLGLGLLLIEGENPARLWQSGIVTPWLWLLLVIFNLFILEKFPNFLRGWEYLLSFVLITYDANGGERVFVFVLLTLYVVNFFQEKGEMRLSRAMEYFGLYVFVAVASAVLSYLPDWRYYMIAFLFLVFWYLVMPLVDVSVRAKEPRSDLLFLQGMFYIFCIAPSFVVVAFLIVSQWYVQVLSIAAIGVVVTSVDIKINSVVRYFLLLSGMSFVVFLAYNVSRGSILMPGAWSMSSFWLFSSSFWMSVGALFVYGRHRYTIPVHAKIVQLIGAENLLVAARWPVCLRHFLSLICFFLMLVMQIVGFYVVHSTIELALNPASD